MNRQGISVPKILVADDNTNIQKMVSLALEERGISVVSVGNGEAAVRRMPDVDPDLVLADIFMPVRNGYEVCEFVKKDERFAHVPVILLVGAFDPLDEKEARRVGADGVLKKPFVPPDPLIAMVTSALEKNPRLAAELAKAKEAKAAPEPEPEPLPSVDLSARPEPKPLPEFPEPSPEEAALVYGFGKGHRSLDAKERVAADGEPPAPKLDPNAQAADDDEVDEASSPDWRRSAMDIEIPEDVASKPTIPFIDDLAPITFPSEKDYPPRRVRVPEPVEEVQPAAASDSPRNENGFSLRQLKHSGAAPVSGAAATDLPEGLKLQSEPELQPPVGVQSTAEAAAQSASRPEPNSTAVGGHWLDAVSASQAGNASGDWMEALVGGQTEPQAAAVAESHAPAELEQEVAAAPEIEASSELEVADEPIVAAPQIAPADLSPEPVQLQEAQSEERHEGDSFFADEAAAQEAPAATAQASEAPSERFAQDSEPAGAEIEMDLDGSEPSLASKDPALVEPPAVHVTPEPLLVEEEPSEPSRYGAPVEETTPLHSFFAPAAEAPAPASSATEHAAAAEFSVQPESESFAETSGEGNDERIPTMPPPNRESLSHIPFLTPSPSFLAEINSGKPLPESRVVDPATVDVVVQKVFEKLQPQLQELLSQGLLKPLVENLLQNELDKKR